MKPFIALAASAPFLLLAGVGHAASFSFSDPNCSGFTMVNGVVSCASTTDPAPTEQAPAPVPVPVPVPTEPAPVVVGSCPTPPAGTTIVNVGSKDSYALKDFDIVFDNPGSTFDSAVAAGASKALQFTNGKTLTGYLSATAGNYGAGYKDWALSLCPGDFTNSLGDKCVLSRKSSINMGFSTDGSLGCKIPANQTVYLNIRGTNWEAAGWVMQNLQMTVQ